MPDNISPPPLPYATVLPPTPEERTLGIVCHLLGLVTGFLGPLILWLVKKNESAFLADQGREALNFQITVLIASFGAVLACFLCVGFVLVPVVAIGNIVYCIIAAVAVSDGKAYRYPWCLRLIA